MPSSENSEVHEYSPDDDEAAHPDYPSPTDEDLRIMDAMSDSSEAMGKAPLPPFEDELMSDDEYDYNFGPRPRPPEEGQAKSQSSPHTRPSWPAASSDGPPPPRADAD
eukprot:6526840-Pyramimonas_sp.AAC.1